MSDAASAPSEVFVCSDCQTSESIVWRRHKATRAVLCNSCYRRLFPLNLGSTGSRTIVPTARRSGGRAKRAKTEPLPAEVVEEDEEEEVEPPAEDYVMPPVETDTEYADIDLEKCPKAIIVVGSHKRKVDGTYNRMEDASRGKPCYLMVESTKPQYLFFNKGWMISPTLGHATNKLFAQLQDAEGRRDPTEPYPYIWQQERSANSNGQEVTEKVSLLKLRVIDASTPEKLSVENRYRYKRDKKEKRGARFLKKARAQIKSEKSGDKASSSSSSSSSGSSGSVNVRRRPLPHGGFASARARTTATANAAKLLTFTKKLLAQLLVLDRPAQQKKLDAVKEALTKKTAALMASGMTVDSLNAAWSRLGKKFGTSAEAVAQEQATEDSDALVQLPAVVCQDPKAKTMDRVSFIQSDAASEPVRVASQRGLGETLWFSEAKTNTMCCACEEEVSQAMGELKGAPGCSALSLDSFVCGCCIKNC